MRHVPKKTENRILVFVKVLSMLITKVTTLACLTPGFKLPNARRISAPRVTKVLALALFAFAGTVSAQTIEEQALAHLGKIKAIRADADEKTVAEYNKSMDAAWTFFGANNGAVLPILRREVTAELQRPTPSDMLLLDVGFYLRLQPDTTDKELGKAALFKLNPASEIVNLNQQQLFDFAFAVASDDDPRVLPFIEKAFLRQKMVAYVARHALPLNETLTCVFLYGVHGPTSEAHLRNLLKEKALAQKILEILIWIGTPDSVPAVKEAMLADKNFDTFGRATTFMMKTGGPDGRAAMLSLNPKEFDAQSQAYLERIRPTIEATSYENFHKQLPSGGDYKPLAEDVVKKRLADMYEHDGKDENTDPRAILDSSLPRTFLTSELVRIRARMFRRLSDEALSDIRRTNAILNVLYYREK